LAKNYKFIGDLLFLVFIKYFPLFALFSRKNHAANTKLTIFGKLGLQNKNPMPLTRREMLVAVA